MKINNVNLNFKSYSTKYLHKTFDIVYYRFGFFKKVTDKLICQWRINTSQSLSIQSCSQNFLSRVFQKMIWCSNNSELSQFSHLFIRKIILLFLIMHIFSCISFSQKKNIKLSIPEPTELLNNSNVKFIDTVIINSIISELNIKPSNLSIYNAVFLVKQSYILFKKDSLINSIIQISLKDEYHNIVLKALKTNEVKSLDPYLADLIPPKSDSVNRKEFIKLLDIISVSGSNLCEFSLYNLTNNPNNYNSEIKLFKNNDLRFKTWESLFNLNRITAIKSILSYYNPKLKIEPPKQVADLLESFFETIQTNRWDAIYIVNEIEKYLEKYQITNEPSSILDYKILTGTSSSPTFKIHLTIVNFLKSLKSPFAQSVLLKFLNSDNNSIQKIVKNENYTVLINNPLLIGFFPNFNHSKNNEWLVLKNIKFKPLEYALIDESQLSRLVSFLKVGQVEQIIPYDPQYSIQSVSNSIKLTDSVSLIPNYLLIKTELDRLSHLYPLEIADKEKIIKEQFPLNFKTTSYITSRSINFQDSILKVIISKSLQPIDHVNSVADLIINDENERKALVLYSILSFSKFTNLKIKHLSLEKVDNILDSIQNIKSDLFVSSHISNNIQPDTIKSIKCLSKYKSFPKAITLKLIDRNYDLDQGIYQEKIEIKINNNKEIFNFYGSIPPFLISCIRRHPRILDFSNYSLFWREMSITKSRKNLLQNDIDLVRENPSFSIPMLIGSLNNLEVPWVYYRDNIQYMAIKNEEAIHYETNNLDFNQNTQTFNEELAFGKFGKSRILSSSAEYKSLFDGLLNDINSFFSNLTGIKIATIIRDNILPKLEDKKVMVSYTYQCNQPYEPFKICTASYLKTIPYRSKFESAANQTISKYQNEIQNSTLYDLNGLSESNISNIIPYKVLVDSNLENFLSVYKIQLKDGNSKFTVVTGSLKDVYPMLRKILNVNTHFIEQSISFDPAGSKSTAFLNLYNSYYNEVDNFLGKPNMNRIINEYGITKSYYNKYIRQNFSVAPFFQSTEGKTIRIKLTLINKLFEFFNNVTNEGEINKNFIDYIINNFSRLNHISDSVANIMAQQKIAEINAELDKLDHNWSFSFGLSINNAIASLGASITYKGFSLGVNYNFDNHAIISGSWNSIKIPYDYDINLGSNSSFLNNINQIHKSINDEIGLQEYVPTKMITVGNYNASNIENQPEIVTLNSNLPSSLSRPPNRPLNKTVMVNDFQFRWNILPNIKGSSNNGSQDNSIGQAWLSGLIARAFSLLTDGEKDQLKKEIKNGSISDGLLNVLYDKGNKAQEEKNIYDRKWIRTEIVSELIPTHMPDKPLPISYDPNLSDIQNENNYISNINKYYETNFEKSISLKKSEARSNEIFEDGLPSVKLLYGNDFKVMQFEYSYRLREGGNVKLIRLYKTSDLLPSNLINKLKKEPNSHVYEKFSSAAVELTLNTFNYPASSFLRTAVNENRLLWEDYIDIVKNPIDDASKNIIDNLKQGIEFYISEFSKWLTQKAPLDYVDQPFIPIPSGVPFLNFFPPPYEWAERVNEPLSQILIYQKNSIYYSKLKNGEISIVYPREIVIVKPHNVFE